MGGGGESSQLPPTRLFQTIVALDFLDAPLSDAVVRRAAAAVPAAVTAIAAAAAAVDGFAAEADVEAEWLLTLLQWRWMEPPSVEEEELRHVIEHGGWVGDLGGDARHGTIGGASTAGATDAQPDGDPGRRFEFR